MSDTKQLEEQKQLWAEIYKAGQDDDDSVYEAQMAKLRAIITAAETAARIDTLEWVLGGHMVSAECVSHIDNEITALKVGVPPQQKGNR